MYSALHTTLVPDQATGIVLDAISAETIAGLRTDASARAFLINGADKDTAVAALTYQFHTGEVPSAAGLAYLVNSGTNPTDLNDAYYSGFNLENRYINFSTNLGVVGEGAASFTATYGLLSFSQTVDAAYEKIIGSTYAAAAGINALAAKADISSRAAYFTALANQNFPTSTPAQQDLAAKAGVVGYIIAEAMKADVGVYAAAMNRYSLALMDGTAVYSQDLLLAYPSTPVTVPPVGSPTPPDPVVVPDPDEDEDDGGGGGPTPVTTNLGAGDNVFVAMTGDNIITAGPGSNTITTGPGNDTITTGMGDDTVNAGDGVNVINGGDGNNTLTTGSGNDTITGGAGNDTISAGDGDNLVTSGAGNDTITTGAGADVIVMGTNLTSTDTISAGAGTDIMRVSGTLAGVAFTSVTGVDVLDLTGASNVTLGAQGMAAGISSVTNSGNGGVIVDAGAFTTSITLTGGSGADTLAGGTNADVLDGGAGVDILNGGTGSDRYVFSGVDADTDVVLTAITDEIAGGFVSGADTLDFTVAGTLANYQEVLPPAVDLTAFIAAADTALNGTVQYYFGVVGADGYLATDADGDGVTTVIKLSGVTDMASGDIV
ncbi:hypothetical protein [Caulobacter sp. NIBR2454]|uniref:hypothetical protein n=1 Tax=Caulobacter sp. NIBR2454 TaxID=3015996 RepID=UPI0022B5F54A|nr:hypothetical protein [Caulobacter sp. NIBR2454]